MILSNTKTNPGTIIKHDNNSIHFFLQVTSGRLLTVIITVLLLTFFLIGSLHAKTRKSNERKEKTPEYVTGIRMENLLDRTRLKLPVNYKMAEPVVRVYNGSDFILKLYARDFVQGNAVYCEFLPHVGEKLPNDFNIKAFFDEREIHLTRRSWGLRGILAIPPDTKSGFNTIEVRTGREKEEIYSFPVKIDEYSFAVYRSAMNLGKYSDRDLLLKRPDIVRRIKREDEKKNKVFSEITPMRIASSVSHPRDYHRVTSSFYAKRIYDRYILKKGKKIRKTPVNRYHYGLDLWGPLGAPIFAMADGVVVIAEEMFYEGKHTVIDHGGGIFTRYMHQSVILVQPGTTVKAGDMIGKTGDTGMVTGPHLHAGLRIGGVYADPESLLYLPVRD